jgi:hypothetical protein
MIAKTSERRAVLLITALTCLAALAVPALFAVHTLKAGPGGRDMWRLRFATCDFLSGSPRPSEEECAHRADRRWPLVGPADPDWAAPRRAREKRTERSDERPVEAQG